MAEKGNEQRDLMLNSLDLEEEVRQARSLHPKNFGATGNCP
jgi:hypothetical protein